MKTWLVLLLIATQGWAQTPPPSTTIPTPPQVVRPRTPDYTLRPTTNAIPANVTRPNTAIRARGGNEGTGGGDPIAAELSALATYVSDYLVDHPQTYASTSRETVRGLIHDISEAMEINTAGGRIEVVDRAAPGDSPFLVATSNPIQITISRLKWNSLSERQRLDYVTRLLVDLSAVSRTEAIPLPVNRAAAYLDKLEACAMSVEYVNEAYEKYQRDSRNCVAATDPRVRAIHRHNSGVQLTYLNAVNDICQRHCKTPQQTFVGAGVCQGYITSYQADLPRLARVAPECVAQ